MADRMTPKYCLAHFVCSGILIIHVCITFSFMAMFLLYRVSYNWTFLILIVVAREKMLSFRLFFFVRWFINCSNNKVKIKNIKLRLFNPDMTSLLFHTLYKQYHTFPSFTHTNENSIVLCRFNLTI